MIAGIESHIVNVSSRTNWFFVRVTDSNGLSGFGEATLYGREQQQLAVLEEYSIRLPGQPVELAHVPSCGQSFDPLVSSSIISALDQALNDLRARRARRPLHALLGIARDRAVRLYANVNRRTTDRTPQGFARSAAGAIAEGYRAVKIAPFDNVKPDALSEAGTRKRIDAGLERILAVREAIGSGNDLLVDCHWRFDEATARDVLRELQPASLFWFECPIPEVPANYPALARLRSAAHAIGTRLAGAEQQVGLEGFRPFIEGGLLDVVMPDVKYAGGYSEMLKIAAHCERHGVAVAPHNPTGPVCTMASAHVSAVAPAFLVLEHQIGESPLYDTIIESGGIDVQNGLLSLPDRSGLGIDLDLAVMRRHPYKPITTSRDG